MVEPTSGSAAHDGIWSTSGTPDCLSYNNMFSSKFLEGCQVRRQTPEEGYRAQQPKRLEYVADLNQPARKKKVKKVFKKEKYKIFLFSCVYNQNLT